MSKVSHIQTDDLTCLLAKDAALWSDDVDVKTANLAASWLG